MTYLYLTTCLFFAFTASVSHNNTASNITLRFPAILGAIVYGILAAKGFGLI